MDTAPFPYSAIVRRAPLAFPDSRRLAFWCGINLEYYAWGRPALSLAEFTAQLVPDPLNHGWREYGPRVGAFRLMELFARHEIPVTGILNSEVCDRHPALVEEAMEHGWSWVAHGSDNSTWAVGMSEDEERAHIETVTERIAAAIGTRPRGWLGPALTESPHTNAILAASGYTFSLNWGIDDEPVDLSVPEGRLLAVPYSTELNDIPAFALQGQSAEDFADALIAQFDQLLEEGARRPRVMGFGLHPFLTGQPYRARAFARVLEHVASHRDDVWLTDPTALSEWFLAERPV